MVSVSSAVIGKAIEQITGTLFKFIGRQIGYVVHCNQNIKKLQDGVGNLRAEMETVQGRADRARDNAEDIEPNVSKWLSDVGDVVKEVDQFLAADMDNLLLKCCNGCWCPHIGLRRRLGKEAKQKLKDVVRVTKHGKFDSVAHRPPQTDTYLFSSTTDSQQFESRAGVFDEIMAALRDNDVYMIGIYGMAGVGKTTMVDQVSKQAKDMNLFDEVAKAVVSQTPDYTKIQADLAACLNLRLDKQSQAQDASLLCSRLKNGKKILVVIDDAWNSIRLEEIGIPSEDHIKGCKIVLTSRRQDVFIEMDVQKEFQIGVLWENEAWSLFKTKVGNTIDSDHEICSVAEEVCRECGGLPLAIITLGAALKRKKPYVWNDALGRLKSCRGNYIQGMTTKVYVSIELSYQFLEHTDTKTCFLYCCLYAEDKEISIEDLLRYGIGRRFLCSSDTVEAMRERVYTIVDTLKTSCLLLEGRYENTVKMHDIIRDAAISIAAKDTEMMLFVRSGGVQQYWPQEDELRYCRTISLWGDTMEELPNVLECPELRTLTLQCTGFGLPRPQEFSDSFFNVTKELEFLNLHNMGLLRAASSISELVKLRVLCLSACEFENLSFLKELKKLEILRISGDWRMKVLTAEVGKLTQLRVLDLKWCHCLKAIPAGVISSLSQLEELYFPDHFDAWKSEGKARIGEINSLGRLSNLQIHISAANALLLNELQFGSLIRFQITIGGSHFYHPSDDSSVNTRILNVEGVHVNLIGRAKALMKKIEALHLARLKGLAEVLEDRDGEWFLDLNFLQVSDCDDDDIMEHGFLLGKPKWNNSKRIQEGKGPSSSPLGKLSVLKVSNCRFKYLISNAVARGLPQLQELVVEGCKSMEEIVGDDDDEQLRDEVLVFPQLKKLVLESLPNLICFYANTKNNKSTAQPLFNQKVSTPFLKELSVGGLESITTIWDIQFGAEGVANVILSLAYPKLQDLVVLEVQSCVSLISIVEMADVTHGSQIRQGEEEDKDIIKLSKLESIKLHDLQNMKSFCSFRSKGEQMTKDKNHQMLTLFSLEVSTPALKELSVGGLENITTIWDIQFGLEEPVSFLQLQKLSVFYCEKLENVVSSSMCAKLQADDEMVKFPVLRSIWLSSLPNIKSFCYSFKSNEEEKVGVKIDKVQVLFNHKVSFPALESLCVWDLESITRIWDNQFGLEVASSFSLLQHLQVFRCEKLVNVISTYVYARLQVGDEMVKFPKLESIWLKELPNIKTFYSVVTSKEEENLEDKTYEVNALFNHRYKVSLLSLKELKIHNLKSITTIWDIQFGLEAAVSFRRLRNLEVKKCENIVHVVSSKFQVDGMMIEFPELESIRLESSPNITSFFHISISKEEEKKENRIDEVKALFNSKVSFPSLAQLSVWELNSITTIWDNQFGQKAVDPFPQLEQLQVHDCGRVVHVVFSCVYANSQMDDEMVQFSKLETIILRSLPNMKSFYCIFRSKEEKMGNKIHEMQALFNHKVKLPCLKELSIESIPNLREIWDVNVSIDSFSNLRKLMVVNCRKLPNVIPSKLLKSFLNLELLTVKDCLLLEEIIGSVEASSNAKEDEIENNLLFPQLKNTQLYNLPKLRSMHSRCRTSEVLSSLGSLNIKECPKLKKELAMNNTSNEEARMKELSSQRFSSKTKFQRSWSY